MDMERKLIKVGTSFGVTFPVDYVRKERLKLGDTICMNLEKVSSRKQASKRTVIRPEVIEWVNRFIEEDRDLLELLKDA